MIALRDGRVLDQGTPAELVARHAPWARVAFGWSGSADLLDALAGLPGVTAVERAPRGQVQVRGARQVIAQVGAELVRRGTVPDDLRTEVPDLEAALLHLLDTSRAIQLTGAPS